MAKKQEKVGFFKKISQKIDDLCHYKVKSETLPSILILGAAVSGVLFSDTAVDLKASLLDSDKKAPWQVETLHSAPDKPLPVEVVEKVEEVEEEVLELPKTGPDRL